MSASPPSRRHPWVEPVPGRTLPRLRALGRVLDDLVRIPGTRFRFGLDPIIGLVPSLGDAAGAVFAAVILLAGVRMGAPPVVLLRMAGNVAVDAIVGAIPVAGDIFDFGFKANRRNLALLERYERAPAAVTWRSRLLLLALVLLVLAILAGAVVGGYYLLHWLATRAATLRI